MDNKDLALLEKLGTCKPGEIFRLAKLNLFSAQSFLWVNKLFPERELDQSNQLLKDEILLRLKIILLLQKILSPDCNIDLNEIVIIRKYIQALEQLGERSVQYEVCCLAVKTINKKQNPLDWAIICAQKARLELHYGKWISEPNWDKVINDFSECLEIFKQIGSNYYLLITQIDLGTSYYIRTSSDKAKDYEIVIDILEPLVAALDNTTSHKLTAPIMVPVIHLLGKAYRDRIYGDKIQNVETAIAFLEIVTGLYWQMGEKKNRVTALFDLSLAFKVRIKGERFLNQEKYISLLMQIMDSGIEVVGGELYAVTCHNLGVAITSLSKKTNDDLIEAIGYYDCALEIYSPEKFPLKRGQTLNAKADAFLDINDRNNYMNLQEAINLLTEAMSLFRSVSTDSELANSYNRLGVAYSKMPLDIGGNSLDKALMFFDLSEICFKQLSDDQGLASVFLNKAITLFYSPTKNTDVINHIIALFQQSLQIYRKIDNKDGEMNALIQLGSILAQDTGFAKQENITKGISYIRDALNRLNPEENFSQWVTAKQNLAYGLLESNRVDRTENIEESILVFKDILAEADPRLFPIEWAKAHSGVCLAYGQRILGDPVENFEYAIGHGLQALEILSEYGNPIEWAKANLNLADCYINLPFGSDQQNFDFAVTRLNNAEKVFKRENYPREYAHIMLNYGLSYSRDKIVSNLMLAIKYYKEALDTIPKSESPEFYAKVQLNLGNTYSLLAEIDSSFTNLAIEHIKESLDLYSNDSYSFNCALAHLVLGLAYSLLEMSNENFLETEAAFISALEIFSKDSYPFYWQTTTIHLQKLYVRYGKLDEALRAGFEILTSIKQFIDMAPSDVSKIYYMRDIPGVGEIVAYILAEKGKYEEAITMLDSVRARVITEDILGLNIDLTKLDIESKSNLFQILSNIRSHEAKLHQEHWLSGYVNVPHSDLIGFHRENLKTYVETLIKEIPELESSYELPIRDLHNYLDPTTCLVLPVITSLGTNVFLIYPQDSSVKIDLLSIKAFSIKNLYSILNGTTESLGLIGIYRDFIAQKSSLFKNSWLKSFDEITGRIWTEFFVFIYEELKEKRFEKIYIFPQGGLNLIPFQAVWREEQKNKKYLIDEFEISVMPTLAMYIAFKKRKSISLNLESNSVLGVINPTKDLVFAHQEGEALKKIFVNAKILSTEANLHKLLIEDHKEYSHLHFACHGFYDWENPWNSGLVIGQDDILTTHDILSKLNFDKCQLITLSACETGIVDLNNPTEYIGFASSFLRVGVPTLITSLWRIDDQATSLLFKKFYEFHIMMKLSPSTALRKAQMWLKDLEYGEISGEWIESTRTCEDDLSNLIENIDSIKRYSHPFYWASFYLIGL